MKECSLLCEVHNNYSKTDPVAKFKRIKEDPMRIGQINA